MAAGLSLRQFFHEQDQSPLAERIGKATTDGVSQPVDGLHRQLMGVVRLGEVVSHRLDQRLDREPDLQLPERAPHRLSGPKAPEVRRPAVPELDDEVLVQHRHPEVHAPQDGLQELIRAGQGLSLGPGLVVRGAQLLVRGLELLVHRLEFFVGGLQLLVRGLELFVGRLQFLVRRLELLVGGLQLLVGRLPLLGDMLELALQ